MLQHSSAAFFVLKHKARNVEEHNISSINVKKCMVRCTFVQQGRIEILHRLQDKVLNLD